METTELSDISPENNNLSTLDDVYDAIDATRNPASGTEDDGGSRTHLQEQPTTTSPYAYPATILPCTRSGNDLLVLVNKSYALPSSYAPTDLVAITQSGVRATKSGLLIRNIIVSDLSALAAAATDQGIDLAVISTYRSYTTQQSTYNYWVTYNGGSTAAADTVSARPGHSQHQLGTAVDFTSSEIGDQLGQQFGTSAAGQWLAQHAWEYGFALAYPSGYDAITGYSYEPWHFRYIGRANAAEWHASGEILEVWLEGKN